VAFVSDASDGNTCPEIITRTYSVTDSCGNSINVTQTITVDDTTDPVATAPVNVNIECITDLPAVNIADVTGVSDNCTANPVVAHVSDVSDGNSCPETITRTYSITDDCLNQITVSHDIIINDVTPPTASNPTDINITVGAPIPGSDPLVVTDEADNCGTPTVAFVSDVTDNGACPETITRTYSVTDSCGNSINVEQLIIIGDDVDPTASNPLPVNVQCIGDVPAVDVTVVTDEADNSGIPPVVTHVSDVSDGNTCPEVITRTYNVADACGNNIDVVQTITVNDDILPTASNAITTNVQCIGDVPAVDITVITDEADNCTAAPVVAFVSEVSDGNTCPETITRTYSVTDDCNNTINVTHTIIVNDDTDPTASNPIAVNVQCIGDVPAFDVTVVTDEADNCTVNPVVAFVSDVSDGLSCPETITRTYSVTDDCNNQITVLDDILPTASNPAQVNIECISDVPAVDITVVTDEADNCTAAPVVAHVSDVSDGLSCPETITRTYSVTDDCNNTINVTQLIVIWDQTAPTASTPAPITVACTSDVPAVDESVVIDEADNCGTPTVAFVSETITGTSCDNEVRTRTYSVTDSCGNQITVDHVITIDADMPTVDAGIDQEMCEGTQVTLTATNYPGNATISWDQGVVDGVAFNSPVGTMTYTVTADVCAGQCVVTDDVNVTVHPTPIIDFVADDTLGCEPHTVTFTNNSTEQFDCVWDMGDGTVINDCGPITYTYDTPGIYDVSLSVTSSEGCFNSYTNNGYIEVVPFPIAAFTFAPTDIDILDTEVDFTNESQHADSYLWNFGYVGGGSSTEENPTHVFPDSAGGNYIVSLMAISDAGCSDQITAAVNIKDVLLFYVPNVFTPDGNSINNTFYPVITAGVDIYNYHLTIFNRWGEVIFESYNPAGGWNGHYGDGGLVQDGVYVWQIEFKETMSDKKHTHRGHVTVLK
jgi:gliding motility-associated-like protein